MASAIGWVGLAFALLWGVVLLALAGVSFFRFRGTRSGWLLAGGFGLWAAKVVVLAILQVVFSMVLPDPYTGLVINEVLGLLGALLVGALLLGGVALIPSSLARLGARTD